MGQQYLYGDFVIDLSKRFEARLDEMKASFNFDLGSEFEVAVCSVLREFLPSRYGICRGFVVAADGMEAGDDIIVYDQDRFPTLRLMAKNSFDRKERIPIEAVFAYIEAKHLLSASTFPKALSQVVAVKTLCATRGSMSVMQSDPYVSTPFKPDREVATLPAIRNPVFGMVLARGATGKDGETLATDACEIDEFLRNQLVHTKKSDHLPDSIIAGSGNFLMPGKQIDGENTPMLYFVPSDTTGYQLHLRPGVAFGTGLVHLAAAIDWIRLGRMPWHEILNNARRPDVSK